MTIVTKVCKSFPFTFVALDNHLFFSHYNHPITNLRLFFQIGLIHKSRPIFSTQFHPEAKGGPLDSSYLFDMYLDNVAKYKQSQSTFQPTRDSRPNALLVDLLAKDRVGVQPTVGMMNMMMQQGSEQQIRTPGFAREGERVYAAGAA